VAADEPPLVNGTVPLACDSRALRIPPSYGPFAPGGVLCEPQAGRADLEGGGTEGAQKAAEAKAAVAQRRLLYPATATASRPCVELSHSDGPHVGRACLPDADEKWTSTPGSVSPSTSLGGSRARTCSSGSSVFVRRGVPEHIRSDSWQRVHGKASTGVARARRREDALHRAWVALGERVRRELLSSCFVTSFSTGRSSTPCSRRRYSSRGGGGTTTPSAPTAPWDTVPRLPRPGSPVRPLRLRLSDRTGLVYRKTNP
jgi:hypothetical protein